jgi:hypothetical protein
MYLKEMSAGVVKRKKARTAEKLFNKQYSVSMAKVRKTGDGCQWKTVC